MKKFTEILCAAILAGSLAACTTKTTVFGTALTDEEGIQLTAKNADKGSESSSGIDVAEGEHVVVAGSVTKGAVSFRIEQDGTETPAAEWTVNVEN